MEGQMEDLHNKIKNRVEGIMLGLEARVLSLSNSLDSLNEEVAKATTNDVASQPKPALFRGQAQPGGTPALPPDPRHEDRLREDRRGSCPRPAMVEIVDRAVPRLAPRLAQSAPGPGPDCVGGPAGHRRTADAHRRAADGYPAECGLITPASAAPAGMALTMQPGVAAGLTAPLSRARERHSTSRRFSGCRPEATLAKRTFFKPPFLLGP